jgi:hypothetical protein
MTCPYLHALDLISADIGGGLNHGNDRHTWGGFTKETIETIDYAISRNLPYNKTNGDENSDRSDIMFALIDWLTGIELQSGPHKGRLVLALRFDTACANSPDYMRAYALFSDKWVLTSAAAAAAAAAIMSYAVLTRLHSNLLQFDWPLTFYLVLSLSTW